MRAINFVSLSLLLLLLAWFTFRRITPREYRTKGRLGPASILLALLAFAFHANLSYFFIPAVWPALPSLPQNPYLRIAGLLLMLAGLAGVVTAMARLGLRTVFGQASSALQQTGVYALSRNPQIIFYGMTIAGYALLWPSWLAAGWFLLYPPVAHMMVLAEEEHLRHVYGQAYEAYRRRVPRYLALPFIGTDCTLLAVFVLPATILWSGYNPSPPVA